MTRIPFLNSDEHEKILQLRGRHDLSMKAFFELLFSCAITTKNLLQITQGSSH